MTASSGLLAFVTPDDVKAHLRLLSAFHSLRRAHDDERQDWVLYVGRCVEKFYSWILKLDRFSEEEIKSSLTERLPELGILMVWHTYLLNPIKYTHAGRAHPALAKIGPFPLLEVARQADKILADALFETALRNEAKTSITVRMGTFDLQAAVLRQSSFIAKVDSLGWIVNPKDRFIRTAIERYRAFLHLMSTETTSSLVPTLDIDLAWHTHQLKGEVYCNETRQLLGHLLDHNDNIPETKLAESFATTEEVWKNMTGTRYLEHRLLGGQETDVKDRPALTGGCGAGGCDGGCGTMTVGACSGGCSGKCGACGGGSMVEADFLSGASLSSGCSSGGCNGECGGCEAKVIA